MLVFDTSIVLSFLTMNNRTTLVSTYVTKWYSLLFPADAAYYQLIFNCLGEASECYRGRTGRITTSWHWTSCQKRPCHTPCLLSMGALYSVLPGTPLLLAALPMAKNRRSLPIHISRTRLRIARHL